MSNIDFKEFKKLFKNVDKSFYKTNNYNGLYFYKFSIKGGLINIQFKFNSNDGTLYINESPCDIDLVKFYIDNIDDILKILAEIEFYKKKVKLLLNTFDFEKDFRYDIEKRDSMNIHIRFADANFSVNFDTAQKVYELLLNYYNSKIEYQKSFLKDNGLIIGVDNEI